MTCRDEGVEDGYERPFLISGFPELPISAHRRIHTCIQVFFFGSSSDNFYHYLNTRRLL